MIIPALYVFSRTRQIRVWNFGNSPLERFYFTFSFWEDKTDPWIVAENSVKRITIAWRTERVRFSVFVTTDDKAHRQGHRK